MSGSGQVMYNEKANYENIASSNNMFYTSPGLNSHPSIQILRLESGSIDQNSMDAAVRREASKGSIKMGSLNSAVSHLKKHPIPNLREFVIIANQLIANTNIIMKSCKEISD